MNKSLELTNRREDLIMKIAQHWDELIEVNEYISAVDAEDIDKKLQKEQVSPTINLREMELTLRDSALRRASRLFSETLSKLDEVRPECPNCGEIMKKKKGERSK